MSSTAALPTVVSTGPRHAKHEHPSPIPANSASLDFHTVTSVAWSASGRNIGIGTPDGFRIFSAEPLVTTLSGSSPSSTATAASLPPPFPASTGATDAGDDGAVQEVYRCAVYGGVGLLSLHKQCSVVAFTGVRQRSAASRVQLADMSQSPPSSFFTMVPGANGGGGGAATSPSGLGHAGPPPRTARPWPAEEDVAAAAWYERWRTAAAAHTTAPPTSLAAPLAFVECPSTVAALRFCPHVVIAASSGDPNIAGSHLLYVFDHRLKPLYTLPVYPPSSNAYLTGMIAIAAAFTASNGAGMMVQRLRVMLPGEKKGEVRLLTLKRSVLTATAFENPASAAAAEAASRTTTPAALCKAGESQHRLVDRVLHQAPLRAVAITEDGRSGVTMSSQGMRLRLLDFVGDDIISERLSLDRGRLPAVTDSVSLAIVPVSRPGARGHAATVNGEWHERCSSDSSGGGGGAVAAAAFAELPSRQYQALTEALHDLVVCLTSSGTLHVFGCGQQQVLFYHSDKTLLPRVGYPYAFSVCLPSQLAKMSGAALFVARSDAATAAMRYLPRREHQPSQRVGRTDKATEPSVDALPGDFLAFQLRYPASLSVRDGSGAGVDGPRSTLFTRYSLSA